MDVLYIIDFCLLQTVVIMVATTFAIGGTFIGVAFLWSGDKSQSGF